MKTEVAVEGTVASTNEKVDQKEERLQVMAKIADVLKLNPFDLREVWESIYRGVPPKRAFAQIKGRALLPAHVLEKAYLEWAEEKLPF